MPGRFRYAGIHCLLAILAVSIALALTQAATWLLPAAEQPPVALFGVAVVVSAWVGGEGPGLLAALLGLLAIQYFFGRPPHTLTFGTDDGVRMGMYVLVVLAVSHVARLRHRAAHALEESERKFRDLFEKSPDAIFVEDLQGNVLDVNPAACRLHGETREQLIGTHIRQLVPDFWREALAHDFPLLAAGSWDRAEGYCKTRDAAAVPVEVRASLIEHARRPALLLHVRDITESKRVEEDLKQTALRLNTLLELTRSIAATLDLDTLVGRLMQELMVSIPGVDVGAIYLYDPQIKRLIPRAHAGLDPELFGQLRLLPGESISGKVFQTGRPCLAQTPAEAAELRGRLRAENERLFAEALGARCIRSNMCVPLRTPAEQVIGTLTLGSATRAFTPADLALLEGIAVQAAVAIENARLFEEVQRGRERLEILSRRLIEVQEAECRRISRELHDEVGQCLTGMKLLLQTASRPGVATHEKLREAQDLLAELTVRLRNLSLELRPSMLDHLGLLTTLVWLLERCEKQMSLRVNLQHSGVENVRFPAEVETAAYRILQEALTNVVRHAGVQEAAIRLTSDGETLVMEVVDRGTGFDAIATARGHETNGLAGMRERTALLGGHFTVESGRGAGTRLLVELPIRARAKEMVNGTHRGTGG